jgi:hypothetical protein
VDIPSSFSHPDWLSQNCSGYCSGCLFRQAWTSLLFVNVNVHRHQHLQAEASRNELSRYALGPEGREFESLRPDHFFPMRPFDNLRRRAFLFVVGTKELSPTSSACLVNREVLGKAMWFEKLLERDVRSRRASVRRSLMF